jgi:hypothetical protein
MKPVKTVEVIPNPKGRVDLLLYRLAEAITHRAELRFSMPGIWDGFVKPIADEKVLEYEGMGPVEFAKAIGFLKPERKRRKLKGAA